MEDKTGKENKNNSWKSVKLLERSEKSVVQKKKFHKEKISVELCVTLW
jgi:hypothetical protein